ncbi:MAG: hypothetical protein WAU81_01595 [Candidatus Aminicenantales bacterium]
MPKKLLGILISGLICAVGVLGSDFSLRLYGGWGYTDGGDLNRSIAGWREYFGDRQSSDFTSSYNLGAMHGASELGAEAVLALSRQWSLSLGIGYVSQKTSGQIFTRSVGHEEVTDSFPEPWAVDFEQTTERRPRYTGLTIPVTLSLDYAFALGSRWALTLGGGGGIYWGRLDLQESYSILSESVAEEPTANGILQYIDRLRTTGEYSEELTGTGFGLHGRLGLEYRLSPSAFLTVAVLGRWVHMKGWEGSRRDASDWQWVYGLWGANSAEGTDERTEDGQLWKHDLRDDATGRSYPILVFSKSAPSPDSRLARINLSGFSVRLGLGFRFGRKV